MKKTLFGTTALVTAGLLASSGAHADGIKLGLGGYMNNYFGIGSSDPDDGTDFAPTGIFSDGEIFFVGSYTADNGITFGANVQLESFTTGDQIDENYGWMEGSFGRLQFGSENTAAYLMHYASPSVGATLNSGWVTSFVPQPAGHNAGFRTVGLSTYLDIGNDENVITYFTPRMFGFQVGVTYAPAVVFTGEGKNFPVYANEDTEYHNGIAVGVNFVESFGAVDLAVAGGYRHAEPPDGPVGGDPSPPSIDQVTFGANIGFAGFTIGGSYANEFGGRVTAANVSTEGQSYDFGITYSTGPWTIGAAYLHGEIAGSRGNNSDDELDAIRAAIEYAVAPGISASVSGMWANWDEENGNDNEGFAGIIGTTFSF
ncbi:MAG: porin [Kiloniellales bacterium]